MLEKLNALWTFLNETKKLQKERRIGRKSTQTRQRPFEMRRPEKRPVSLRNWEKKQKIGQKDMNVSIMSAWSGPDITSTNLP